MSTRECVHLVKVVTSGYPKTLRRTHTPLHLFMCYRLIDWARFPWSYWRWNVHTAGIRICADTQVSVAGIQDGCRPFLLLWPWLDQHDLYSLSPSLEMHPMCKNELSRPTSRLSKVIVWQTYIHTIPTDRQNQPKLQTTPLRGWSMKRKPVFMAFYPIRPVNGSGLFYSPQVPLGTSRGGGMTGEGLTSRMKMSGCPLSRATPASRCDMYAI